MQSNRWWSVAAVGTSVILLTILLLDGVTGWPLAVACGGVGLLIVSWFSFGIRSEPDSAGAVAFAVVIIASASSVVLATPTLAIVQCFAFPMLWLLTDSLRRALVYNTTLALAVGVALYFSTGAQPDSVLQAVTIELLSLAVSIGIGLWITAIATRSDERQALLDELRMTQAELAILSRDSGVTSERERLAREIHDTIAQDLTGLVMLAQRASREFAAGTLQPAQLAILEENAQLALAETRALVASSASPSLGEDGIAAAIERLATRFERETGIAAVVAADVAAVVDRDSEVVLLRCAQEALANVRKHSGARAVTITLRSTTDAAFLEIADDGSGFDSTAEGTGYGLSGLRDRVSLVAGTLGLASGDDGTRVSVALPAKGFL